MYSGYLIKINGVVVPNKYIDVKTYKATPNKKRVIETYYDGNGVFHEVYSPHTTSEIEFSTNAMLLSKKNGFIGYFPTSEGLTVEYYNDKTDSYATGTFRMSDLQFERFKARESDIIYKPINVLLKED